MRRVLVACALLAACGSHPPKLRPHVDYELPAEVEALAPPHLSFLVRTPDRIEDLDPETLVVGFPDVFGLSVVQAPHDGALAGQLF